MIRSLALNKANISSTLAQVPTDPGVYLYKARTGEVIYVGKAKNLKVRVSSYFASHLLPKTKHMIDTAYSIELRSVSSELEALLLEAYLVKQYMPTYNFALKDDKSALYVLVTKDTYPRVITARKTQLGLIKAHSYGPFINTSAVRFVLKQLRLILPYATHLPDKRGCIYSQIGLCNPCPSIIEHTADPLTRRQLRRRYLHTIALIKVALAGKVDNLKKSLQAEMDKASKAKAFELAASYRDKLALLTSFEQRGRPPEEYVQNPNLASDIREEELSSLSDFIGDLLPISKLDRIECFDIAHLGGTFPTASMVVVTGGEIDKKNYKHFTVRNPKKRSDTDALKEVVERRMQHLADWGRPDLIIIDGGKPQVSAVAPLVAGIPMVGLAKQFETLVVLSDGKFSERKVPAIAAKRLLVRIRDESHRFARRLHHHHVYKAISGV